ncbi:MAG: hypothetical protein ACOH1X_02350 [Kaistella sp.]
MGNIKANVLEHFIFIKKVHRKEGTFSPENKILEDAKVDISGKHY